MAQINRLVETHHKAIIYSLLGIIAFFLLACSLNGILPICHYVFGCDHGFHSSL